MDKQELRDEIKRLNAEVLRLQKLLSEAKSGGRRPHVRIPEKTADTAED